jgi:small-conductance mechanosensitive channel
VNGRRFFRGFGADRGDADRLPEDAAGDRARSVVFAIFYAVAKTVRRLVRRYAERREQYRNLDLVLGRLAQWAIIFLGILVAVTIVFPTFSPGDLITVLGVGGVAIGFAFKDIFQNFLAGILILLTEPFRVGDQIIVGDYEGTVQEIQTRATFIRTYDGRRVVIPNADLFTDKVLVNTAFGFPPLPVRRRHRLRRRHRRGEAADPGGDGRHRRRARPTRRPTCWSSSWRTRR